MTHSLSPALPFPIVYHHLTSDITQNIDAESKLMPSEWTNPWTYLHGCSISMTGAERGMVNTNTPAEINAVLSGC